MIALWYATFFFFNVCFIRCLACLFVRRQISPNTRVYIAIVGEFLFILLIGSFIIWPALEAATILIFQVSLKSPFFHFRSDHMYESLDEKRLIRCSVSREQFGWLLTRNQERWAPIIQIKDHVCPPDPALFPPMALYFLSVNLSSLSITSHKKKRQMLCQWWTRSSREAGLTRQKIPSKTWCGEAMVCEFPLFLVSHPNNFLICLTRVARVCGLPWCQLLSEVKPFWTWVAIRFYPISTPASPCPDPTVKTSLPDIKTK